MVTVTVCVGSSCHVKGARDMIECFKDLLTENSLTDKIELQGSFCMERCGEGVNWRIDDESFTSATCEDAVAVFREKLLDTPADASPGENNLT
ncbi:MAG: (2Fe-2S) ferredoxin domain-containing protein [Phycisphaerae bacterium]|nr:(2Fe-2S) ferredoxin domain-containing protein [Phycisphaerae bacterium]